MSQESHARASEQLRDCSQNINNLLSDFYFGLTYRMADWTIKSPGHTSNRQARSLRWCGRGRSLHRDVDV